MEELTGKIDGILYSDRNTGFYILKLTATSLEEAKVVVTGTFPGIMLSVGLKATFRGTKWVEHPVHGRQISASACEVSREKGKNGVVSYLISCVPSIGPVTAGKLYAAYGDELFDILESSPDKILECDFLTKAQSKAILDEWKNASYVRTASVFLVDLGLNANQVKSVYGKFGQTTVDVVKADPYRLYECPGVGFLTADNAARKLGIGRDDPRRIRSIVLFTMSEAAFGEGHMYVTSDQIKNSVQRLFRKHSLEPFSHGDFLSNSMFYPALSSLKATKEIVADGDRLYLAGNWVDESESAACLADMVAQPPVPIDNLEAVIDAFEAKTGIELSVAQRESIYLLTKSRVCVISGYPGTGKTLLISAFVHIFEHLNLNYSLMSPTGIAAKRLSQVSGKTASTIHRALGYGRDGVWEFDRSNKFVSDAVIVDETSMVDSSTFYHLVSALPSSTILVLVGDSAQLPSVGAGHVLKNLIDCKDVPSHSLTKIYRQTGTSDIVSVAHAILRGDQIDTTYRPGSEFLFLPFPEDKVIEQIRLITSKMKDKGANFQVMAPVYDGELGVNSLNQKLREVLNSEFLSGRATKIKLPAGEIYEGDRVMIVKNDYDRAVFNGDVGKVQRISIKDDLVEIRVFDWFDQDATPPRYVDKIFPLTIEEARNLLRVAYACTVHKVQGQEFDFAIIPMTMAYGIMLYRNLLYTAITRAKKRVFVFGDPKAFHKAVANLRETVRNSGLSDLVSRRLAPVPYSHPPSVDMSIPDVL